MSIKIYFYTLNLYDIIWCWKSWNFLVISPILGCVYWIHDLVSWSFAYCCLWSFVGLDFHVIWPLLDEILVYYDLIVYSGTILRVWAESGNGEWVWPCGGPQRNNVTRWGLPQGQGGGGWRTGVFRWGGPPPSCGGVRRRTVIRWCVPQGLWESTSRDCFGNCCLIVSPFVLNIVGVFCWVFYHVFGVFIHAFCWVFIPCLWSIYSCLLVLLSYSCFVDSLIMLSGSWFVFIVEMNTLFGCFGLSWSMSMWWWILGYLLEIDGWTNCATIDYIWTLVPVIGLRSLWLDFGPCDWVFTPVIGLRSLLLGFYPYVPNF